MKIILIVSLIVFAPVFAAPGGPEEPVRVVNDGIDMTTHDGGLRPAIGVENIEVMRANRMHPEMSAGHGWTYNHAPFVAYWQGRFYVHYLSNPFGEHVPPGQTLVVTSADGRTWGKPAVVFPIYHLRPGPITTTESGMAMMHQRMGFHVAPNGRLLVLGFYGHAPSPYGKFGIGRVVREAYKDGTYGPIHFIRYNEGVEEAKTRHPLYTRSGDAGFVAACQALLADRLKTMQWWEEDRSTDGFYTVTEQQAPAVYHRKDGTAVVLWKASWAALSSDEGKSWSTPVQVPSIITDGAKTWGQRTSDGRYAIAYNPANYGSHRWPLALATGDDGITFEQMVLINGEVAPRRYFGRAKDFGLQYVRGISEGNGEPPGGDMWVTYSENKEDIWVSRIPMPVRHRISGPVADTFDQVAVGGKLADWNLHRPKWAPVGVAAFPSARNKSLQFEDRDPYDYAKAVRVFAEASAARISCRVHPRQVDTGRFEIEVLDGAGHRPVRIVLAESRITAADGDKSVEAGRYRANAWVKVELTINAADGKYDLALDGKPVVRAAAFAEPAASVERISFRTGEFRTEPTRKTDRYAGGDLPNADEPAPLATFFLDDVRVN